MNTIFAWFVHMGRVGGKLTDADIGICIVLILLNYVVVGTALRTAAKVLGRVANLHLQ